MRKLSIRKRGKKGLGAVAWEVGDPAFGRAVMVSAPNKREALAAAKPKIKARLAAVSAERLDLRQREKQAHRQERFDRAREAAANKEISQ